jgi:hypothetical protein
MSIPLTEMIKRTFNCSISPLLFNSGPDPRNRKALTMAQKNRHLGATEVMINSVMARTVAPGLRAFGSCSLDEPIQHLKRVGLL